MTTHEAARILDMHPVTVAKLCRLGTLKARRHQRGRCGAEWEVLETPESLGRHLSTPGLRSQRATAAWATRRKAAQGTRPPERVAHDPGGYRLLTNDEIALLAVRRQARDGNQAQRTILMETQPLLRWWSAERGDIIGRTTEQDRHQFAQSAQRKMPTTPVVAYHPGVG